MNPSDETSRSSTCMARLLWLELTIWANQSRVLFRETSLARIKACIICFKSAWCVANVMRNAFCAPATWLGFMVFGPEKNVFATEGCRGEMRKYGPSRVISSIFVADVAKWNKGSCDIAMMIGGKPVNSFKACERVSKSSEEIYTRQRHRSKAEN